MSTVDITLSDDLMQACLSIPGGGQFNRDELLRELTSAGITYGIDEAAIDKIVQEAKPVDKLLVAKGKESVPGEDAKLIWNVDLEPSSRPQITEKGQADFKKLALVLPVVKDQILVSKLPLTAGTTGRTVTGQEISEPGKDISLPEGINTCLSDDNLTILAGREGHAYWEAGKLKIDPLLAIDSDVDYGTGNVQYDGSILINGDVRTGFRVEATGSIFIGGTVEAATIYSENGDVNIAAGILGRGKAKIFAGKNMSCSFAQDTTIGVNGDLSVDRYLINCDISAEGGIDLGSEVGLIRGGKIKADVLIHAREIGTEKNIPTEIIVGSQHNPKGSSAKWGIREQRNLLENELAANNQRLQFIELLKNRLPKLTPDRETELQELTVEIKTLEQQLALLVEEESKLQNDLEQHDQDKMIKVTGQLHRNVLIEICGVALKTDREYNGVMLSRHGDEIRIAKLLTSKQQS